ARRRRIRRSLEIALAARPAVVAALDAEVDLLDRQVAHVADPERSGAAVEAEAKGIAEAVRPDLAPVEPDAHERVVGGDGSVEVDAQDLPVERRQVLRVGVRRRARPSLVVAVPAVTRADVELPVHR